MYIHVRVLTKQKTEKVERLSEDKFKISVREEAKQNRANERVIELLKEHLQATRIRLVSGHHSPGKLFSVEIS